MALINCKECGKEISNMASTCPHCGCPINATTEENIVNEETTLAKCTSCGKEIPNTCNYCIYCGNNIKNIENNEIPEIKNNEMTEIKNDNNKIIKKIIIIIFIIIIILAIIGLFKGIKIYQTKKKIAEEYANFKEQHYLCRNNKNSNVANVDSVSPIEVNVKIIEEHYDYSSYDNIKNFMDKYCNETEYIPRSENQINYHLDCGTTKDTITYTYVGKIEDAIKEIEPNNYECILREESNSDNLNELINNYWCEYDSKKGKTYWYYTFDNKKTYYNSQFYESSSFDYDYYLNGNTLTIDKVSYDMVYKYDEKEKQYVGGVDSCSSCKDNILKLCEKPIVYNKVSTKYFIIRENSSIEKQYYVSQSDYNYSRHECSNGNNGKWDNNIWHFIPNENIDSVCNIYFVRK